MKPTQREVLDHVRERFGLSLTEALEVMKTPVHPAGLRDEFAMAAMSGMLANQSLRGSYPQVAKSAYTAADAMLEERIKEKSNENT